MRVLFLVHEFPVLSQTFIVNQALGLLAQGHDLTIGCLVDTPVMEPIHGEVLGTGLLDRVRRPVPVPPGPVRRLGSALRLLRAGRVGPATGLSLLDPVRHGRDGPTLRALHRLAPLAGLPPFDVIHAQFGTVAVEALHLRRAGIIRGRLLTSFRGYDISSTLHRHGPCHYADLFREGDWFLTNCRFFRDRLLDLGCPGERLSILPSGLDLARFPLVERAAWDGGRPIELLFVGRLVAKKGVEDAIRAVAGARMAGIPLRLTIVGDGPLRRELGDLAAGIGLGENVVFTGAATGAEIRARLAVADLFIAPSRTAPDGDQDAPTNVLKEAMASGLPVIATRHGGIPELVEDGVSGHLAGEGEPAALAAILCRLAGRPEAWAAMGQAGRARVAAEYDLERLNGDLCTNYAAMLDSPAPQALPARPGRQPMARRAPAVGA
jgi:colanic acid/amylovoran biosynthesis glycosyltransferase